MIKAAGIGAFFFNLTAGFIGGSQLFDHPEWMLLFGAEGAIIFGIGYAITRTREA